MIRFLPRRFLSKAKPKEDYLTRLIHAGEDEGMHQQLFPAFPSAADQVRIKEARTLPLESPLTVNGN